MMYEMGGDDCAVNESGGCGNVGSAVHVARWGEIESPLQPCTHVWMKATHWIDILLWRTYRGQGLLRFLATKNGAVL